MKVSVPQIFSRDLAEECGLHAGDGSMNYYNDRGLYSLRGNKKTGAAFYSEFVLPLYERIYSFKPVLREWRDVIGFQVCSSKLVEFKQTLGFPLGPKNNVRMPAAVTDAGFGSDFLRGFLETDGCVYPENKYGKKYPRIELSTISEPLSSELSSVIRKQGISCSVWRQTYDNGWKPIYRVSARGKANAKRWLEKIGTNHPRQREKLDSCVKWV